MKIFEIRYHWIDFDCDCNLCKSNNNQVFDSEKQKWVRGHQWKSETQISKESFLEVAQAVDEIVKRLLKPETQYEIYSITYRGTADEIAEQASLLAEIDAQE